MSKLLDLPSKKVFHKDLTTCRRAVQQDAGNVDPELRKSNIKIWLLESLDKPLDKPFEFSVVWTQGIVTRVDEKADLLYIDDGTAIAKVIGSSKIPFLSQKIKSGNYIMVIGQLINSGNIPLLRAIKVQNLSHVVDGESSWILEVMDQMML